MGRSPSPSSSRRREKNRDRERRARKRSRDRRLEDRGGTSVATTRDKSRERNVGSERSRRSR